MKSTPTLAWSAAALACCLGLGGLWSWRARLVTTEGELEQELGAAQAKWAVVSAQQKDADAARVRFAILTKLEAQFAGDRAAPKWASLLKVLVTNHGPETQLTRIDARTKATAPEVCELLVSGTSSGQPHARASAERFRRSLLAVLESLCTPGSVAVDFSSLQDLPASAGVEQSRCAFTLTAKFTPTHGNAHPTAAGGAS